MTDHFLTISTYGKGLYTEKRSRFLSFAVHVENEEEVKEYIEKYKKKFYDARHICYAYTLGPDGERTRSVDAGEPSGTAGRPILGQIKSKRLTYTLVVVVRYFGGIQLGVANLGRAYQAAEYDALDQSTIEERIVTSDVKITVAYPDVDTVMKIIKEAKAHIIRREYDAHEEHLTIAVRLNDKSNLTQRLQQIVSLSLISDNNGG